MCSLLVLNETPLCKLLWQFTQEPPGVSVSVTNLILFGPENLAFTISPPYSVGWDSILQTVTRTCGFSLSFSIGGWSLVFALLSPFSGTTTQSYYGTLKFF